MERFTDWMDDAKTEVSIVNHKMRDAMLRLAAYEDTGLMPEDICKRQIAKKPLPGGNTNKLTGEIFICPSCSGIVGIDDERAAYCADCGQALDW